MLVGLNSETALDAAACELEVLLMLFAFLPEVFLPDSRDTFEI
jgi:hypothetical protein